VESPPPPSAYEVELRRRFTARLEELGSCTRGLKKRGLANVFVSVSPSGKTEVFVNRTNVSDCKVIACLKAGLTQMKAPPATPEGANLDTYLELEPGKPPRPTGEIASPAEQARASCTDDAPTSAAGRLPPETIQSVVRAHYGRFRACYDAGLARDPRLTGRVGIRFVIRPDGHVTNASVVDNTLPNCAVSACVRNRFKELVFPKPEGGVVTVVYPIMLKPG
jgi:hypothetical protein